MKAYLSALVALSCAAATNAQLATYTVAADAWQIVDVTVGGQVVVGNMVNPADPLDYGAFYWRWKIDLAPTYVGGGTAMAVSEDGSIIAGDIEDPVTEDPVAAIWSTVSQTWQSCGYLPNALSCPSRSGAYDVWWDGSAPSGPIVTGLSWDGCNARAFRWTQGTGMVEQELLGNGNSRASAISSAGYLVGFTQGNFSKTPALWYPDGTGLVFDMDVIYHLKGCYRPKADVLGPG